MNRRRGAGSNLGVLLLGTQLMNQGVGNVPPVTLALIIGQTAIFLDAFHQYFPSAYGVCMSSYLVTKHKDWHRMILGSLFHADDMHLYFNMVSLLYKGLSLEPMFGSVYFAFLISVFTFLTSATYVGLGLVLGQALNPSYFTSCAVGFSGVLFALKVLSTEYSSPGTQYAFGMIPIPSKYIFWAELVLIQLITPNASFVGHLAGILVGLAYTRGPLKPLMDSFIPPARPRGSHSNAPRSGHRRSGPASFFGSFFGRGQARQPYPPRSQRSSAQPASSNNGYGYTQPSAPPAEDFSDSPGPRMPQPEGVNYQRFTGGLDEDEQIRRAMEESMHQQGNPSPSSSFQGVSSDDENEQLQRAMEESLRQSTRQNPSSQRLYPDIDELRSRRAYYYQ